jgi:precorrin-6B methylase 2
MNNKDKFTNKAEKYAKYRPIYPPKFIEYLFTELGFTNNSIVADIGAGTGILSKLLAEKVKTIYAVEPNTDMRNTCKESCKKFKNIITINGSAEDTTLPDNSIDCITIAQAFHWFDKTKCMKEFKRILKTNNKVVLLWNRKEIQNPFVKENDDLCRKYCPDFKGVAGNSNFSPEYYKVFFKNKNCEYKIFDNDIICTLETYVGVSLSTSYSPSKNDPIYQNYIDELTALFHKYNYQGKLFVKNKTHSYAGQV